MDLRIYLDTEAQVVRAEVFGRKFDTVAGAVRWLERLTEDARAAMLLTGDIAPGSTKFCPGCGCLDLALVRTHNEKHCPDCGLVLTWNLAPGQPPIA